MESTQHPLDAIAGNNATNTIKKESMPSGSAHPEGDDQPNDTERDSCTPNKSLRASVPIPHTLNLSGLKSPAIILDISLRVVWQNKMAIDQIWHRSRTANNGNPTPDIFDLLFDPQFQAAVDNWRQWVAFFIRQVLALIPADRLQRRIEQMNHRQQEIVSSVMARQNAGNSSGNVFSSHLRQILASGGMRPFNVAAVDFNEGRLLTFVPETYEDDLSDRLGFHDIERRYDIVRRHPNPIQIGFGVLSTCLNNSASLKTELLPEEYCRLLNELYRKCIDSVERFGGVFSKHSDRGFSAYFLPVDDYDEGPSVNPIKCALTLKDQMAEFSRQWKIRKSWRHEIALNIGIHREKEHLGILASFLGDTLTNFGSALSITTGLSRLSSDGQIWATKAIINGMPISLQSQLRFGIQRPDSQRRPVFIQSSFSDIRDLFPGDGRSVQIGRELEALAVTQIFDLQAPL